MSGVQRAREQRGAVSSKNWLQLQHCAEGSYTRGTGTQDDDNMAVFDFSMQFRVFDNEWTVIPLVDAQVIADNWAVSRSASEKAMDSSEASWDAVDDDTVWSPVSLTGDALLLLQELDDAPLRQVFATNKAGLYKITFSVYEFVRSSRNLP